MLTFSVCVCGGADAAVEGFAANSGRLYHIGDSAGVQKNKGITSSSMHL